MMRWAREHLQRAPRGQQGMRMELMAVHLHQDELQSVLLLACKPAGINRLQQAPRHLPLTA